MLIVLSLNLISSVSSLDTTPAMDVQPLECMFSESNFFNLCWFITVVLSNSIMCTSSSSV